MEKQELEGYKEVLLKLRTACLQEMERIGANSLYSSIRDAGGELSGYTQHMADMATDGYETEKNINLIDKESNLLYEIEEALYRIEKGGFGQCEGCGNLIDPKRLKVKPYARYCIKCLTEKRT